MTRKFEHPDRTATGQERARVLLRRLDTLWLNTGTLCNIACRHCYIESTPTNDALVYLTRAEAAVFLDEALSMGTREIGITGGEPFMNPHLLGILEDALDRGYEVLVLTNAMRPMMRPTIQAGLMALRQTHGERLTLRVSLDHYTRVRHDSERGEGGFEKTVAGLRWLAEHQFRIAIAGRTLWLEDEATARAGYAALLRDVGAPEHTPVVLFPEMRPDADPPEISTACWDILGKSPNDVMCSSSRMVVKRRGADAPVVLSCTLLAYDPRFELGATLAEAARPVALNHPWCATFCVLGGSSCS